jgi:hypothetical protein
MSTQRSTDATSKTRFRTDRFFCDKGLWYFSTRENTVEGPYATRKSAEQYRETYLTLMRLAPALDVALEPLDGDTTQPLQGGGKVWDFDHFSGRFSSAA